jgi:hypothetical protein
MRIPPHPHRRLPAEELTTLQAGCKGGDSIERRLRSRDRAHPAERAVEIARGDAAPTYARGGGLLHGEMVAEFVGQEYPMAHPIRFADPMRRSRPVIARIPRDVENSRLWPASANE